MIKDNYQKGENMKKILSILTLSIIISMICSFGFTNNAYAQTTGKVVVSGFGEVSVEPDIAYLSFGVESTADTLSEADKDNKTKVSKLYNTLKQNNIEEKDIKTQGFYAHQKYDYSENQPKLIGYTISNAVMAKTTDLKNLSNLLSTLIEDGSNLFHGINFAVQDTQTHYQKALSLALDNAKTKAATLLGNQNLTATEIIEESFMTIRNFKNMAAYETADNSSIFGGEIVIKANVKVVFETADMLTATNNQPQRDPIIEQTPTESNTPTQPNTPTTNPQDKHPKEIQPETAMPIIDVTEPNFITDAKPATEPESLQGNNQTPDQTQMQTPSSEQIPQMPAEDNPTLEPAKVTPRRTPKTQDTRQPQIICFSI